MQQIPQILQFAEQGKYLPPLILVGIMHSNRKRDLTPTADKTPNSGGGPNLLAFIKNELQPYINKSYSTSSDNILHGHSLGGLFVVYALLSEPQLFSSYLAVDPSFWWDDNTMNKLAAEKLSSLNTLNKTLFISGHEGTMDEMGIGKIDSILKANLPADLQLKVIAYENESHGSVRLKSI